MFFAGTEKTMSKLNFKIKAGADEELNDSVKFIKDHSEFSPKETEKIIRLLKDLSFSNPDLKNFLRSEHYANDINAKSMLRNHGIRANKC